MKLLISVFKMLYWTSFGGHFLPLQQNSCIQFEMLCTAVQYKNHATTLPINLVALTRSIFIHIFSSHLFNSLCGPTCIVMKREMRAHSGIIPLHGLYIKYIYQVPVTITSWIRNTSNIKSLVNNQWLFCHGFLQLIVLLYCYAIMYSVVACVLQ